MNWKMDFDKTSFSVDWFTSGNKYVPKRLSFPKSARISIDDFVSDSPLSFCFSPVGEVAIQRPRSYSFVDDAPLEGAVSGWTTNALPSPFISPPSADESYPMYDLDAIDAIRAFEEKQEAFVLPHPGLASIVNDCASCGVNMDPSCLNDLDEQLLVSPMECFTELCWAEAVQDEQFIPSPSTKQHRRMRSRARSFKRDDESPPLSPPPFNLVKDRDGYPGSFERARPLAAKITLPLETFPHAHSSPFSESYDTLSTFQEKRPPFAHILYADPDGSPFPHSSSLDVPRRHLEEKRFGGNVPTKTKTATMPKMTTLPTPRLQPARSNQVLGVISDACATTFARARRKPPPPF